MKIVGVILSYNAPEITDRLFENIFRKSQAPWPVLVVDNGSETGLISQYTDLQLPENVRMTRGFNAGLQFALDQHPDLDAVWLFTNDCFFTSEACPLTSMRSYLRKYSDIGIIHPSEHPRVEVCYDVKHSGRESGLKIVPMFDIVCPLFTRRALEVIGWEFDPELYLGWGIDFESSYLVRQAGLKVAINYDLIVDHETSSTYDLGRDRRFANRQSYYKEAGEEMERVLGAKYGKDWKQLMEQQYCDGVGSLRS